jgi:acyl-coenzyme A thioesterase PaaI-like protein
VSAGYRQTMGVISSEADDDVRSMPFNQRQLGRPGFLHGGAIAGFLAIACDGKAEAEGGEHNPATTSMNYLRGGRERDTFARAIVRAQTTRLLVIEASAWQDSPDKPIAIMTRTYLRR